MKHTQSLQENVAEYAKRPLRQEPGTKYEYNNCGINTGGRIIEVVSGMTYADFMQQRLFDPLGMKDTTFWPNAEQAARLAHTARRNVDKPDRTCWSKSSKTRTCPPRVIEKWSEGVPVPPAITADMGQASPSAMANATASRQADISPRLAISAVLPDAA